MTGERVLELLRDIAALRGPAYAGEITDREALAFASEHDLVERYYEGAGAILGLAKVRLTK